LNAADGTPNAPQATRVARINDLKSLQNEMGTMLSGHTSKQIQLYPDTARAEYYPGDKITFTLNAHEADYINLENSVIWAKLHLKRRQIYNDAAGEQPPFDGFASALWEPPVLANGGAGLVNRLRIFSGTTELQEPALQIHR